MMMRIVAVLALATAVAAPGYSYSEPPQRQSEELARILELPFASSLIADPRGARIAWVIDVRGARNLYVAEAPSWSARRITHFDDDGQVFSGITWSAAGDALYFVRGDDWTGAQILNPALAPIPPDRSVWKVALDGSQSVRVAQGRAPAVSSRGDLAFLRDGDLHLQPAGAAESTVAVRSRGGISRLRWSPSGNALAFVDSRGDHSYIGVYEHADRRLRYLDPSVDGDSDPAWSPDGSRIAFLRTPAGAAANYYLASREDEPFSIRVAELSSAKGREVWRADRGTGSVFRRVSLGDQLMWAAGDRLVFPWEKNGWLQLHSVAASGGEAKLLTPGAHEVEDVSLSSDGRVILFSSNLDDPERRHIWRVAPDGGGARKLTIGTGIESNPVPLGDGASLAYLAADVRRPMRALVRLRDGSQRELQAAAPPGVTAGFVEPRSVAFSATDGKSVPAQLFLPAASSKRHPAVMFIHGGPPRQTLLGYHNRYYYSNAYALNQYLASRGYVVLSVNYRRSIGYGLDHREAPDNGISGASDFRDILGAGLYLRSRADVDPARIGLWGGSYGGYLVAMGLARASDLFAAGVDLHGVHDWSESSPDYFPAYDPRQRFLAGARAAFESSPLASMDTWRSPVLLIHGDDDRNVPFSETVNLVRALRQRGIEHEQLVFPNEAHDFLLHRHWLEAYSATVSFLERKLAARPEG